MKQHDFFFFLVVRAVRAAFTCFDAKRMNTGHLGAGGRGAGTFTLNVSPLEEWREGELPHTSDGSASFISIARLYSSAAFSKSPSS